MAFNFSFWILMRLHNLLYFPPPARNNSDLIHRAPSWTSPTSLCKLQPFQVKMIEEPRSWDQSVEIPIKPMWSQDCHQMHSKTVTKLSPSHPMQLQNDLKSYLRSEYFENSLQVPIFPGSCISRIQQLGCKSINSCISF